jgi:RNA-directed DNA polymerase
MPKRSVTSMLARAFVSGDASAEAAAERAARMLGRPFRWLAPLARRYLTAFAGRTRPRHREVVRFLDQDPGFQRAWARHKHLRVAEWLIEPQDMQPAPAAASWPLPVITSVGALAQWLQLEPGDLEWFADLKGLAAKNPDCPRLAHYHYRILSKSFGRLRLIEAPKTRLKALQRRILEQILDRIPPHPAVHGFCKGRSIVTFAAPHVGRRVVLRLDLEDFFPSFSGARVQAFFRTLGYPEAVADLLGGLSTNATPRSAWNVVAGEAGPRLLWEASALYARPHLPQGAPTSPALANACAYRLDCRLEGLARSAGAAYTRYADDLAFSGGPELEAHIERFADHAAAIALEEGFRVHHRKTRIMKAGVRQYLAGVVANARINVARADFDRLKATLTNCLRQGPESQNRASHPDFRAHLRGRIEFVRMLNPAKAERLSRLFERIGWPERRR